MADGGFDPCECIFNHEMAMRRLLSLLRSSQTYCTDNECLQDGMPGPGQTEGTSDNFMMMMIGWMLMAAVMFFLRPNSMRNNSAEGKPSGEIFNSQKNWFFFKFLLPQVQAGTLRNPGILLQALVRALTPNCDNDGRWCSHNNLLYAPIMSVSDFY